MPEDPIKTSTHLEWGWTVVFHTDDYSESLQFKISGVGGDFDWSLVVSVNCFSADAFGGSTGSLADSRKGFIRVFSFRRVADSDVEPT